MHCKLIYITLLSLTSNSFSVLGGGEGPALNVQKLTNREDFVIMLQYKCVYIYLYLISYKKYISFENGGKKFFSLSLYLSLSLTHSLK